jgi:transcription-repair coupling factor (superfamily II helicase)
VSGGAGKHARWSGLPGPAVALALAEAAATIQRPLMALCVNEGAAYELEAQLRFFADEALPLVHLPDTEVLPYDAFSPHQELVSDRLAALARLPDMRSGIVITTAETLLTRFPPRQWLEARRFELAVGDRLDPMAFREKLSNAGYQSVSEVQTQGEFAVRGALVDLFPMGSDLAYRLDLFDEDIESIRCFDPETQRSTHEVKRIQLLPAREFPTDKSGIDCFRRNYRAQFSGDPSRSRVYDGVSKGFMPAGIEAYLPLFFDTTAGIEDYLPQNMVMVEVTPLDQVLASEWRQIGERHERYSGNIERPLLPPEQLYREPAAALRVLDAYTRLSIGEDGEALNCSRLAGDAEVVAKALADAPRALLVAESPGRMQAVQDWLKPRGMAAKQHESWSAFAGHSSRIGITQGPLQESLRLPDGTLLIAEAQIFGLRAQVASRQRASKVRDPETLLRDLSALNIGSPVVHTEHGVGRYQGLTKLDAGGLETEYLIIEYAEGDKVYVPVAQLGQVHRYTGAEAEVAPLHSLGSDRWRKATERARARAHDVAAELLQIQARRAARVGTAMPVDELEYRQFCEAFPFETTPDQQRAIDEVLGDMASERAMDRVVCGDVGFGKTEVALRASFAAIQNHHQVCVLVPTTLLAQQHYKNFCDRYAQTAVRIAVASRLKSERELGQLMKDLEDGKVDIVIGTHRLLQTDVRFKQLGLVIVDEEHRFGVRHKERLKNLRAQVDMLTLTATPIPRTLNMSLAGLRDLSIIATPPSGRMAIKTFVSEWERGLVQEAFMRELKRGGQIYYLHNHVRDIERVAADLRDIVPEARIRVAHGQMRSRELEQVMLDFYHHRFDVLCCTTIVESGIDVPNANTIVIDRADHLGLAQLHQLRGRVGRSHHRAYAYMLVPSRQALSDDAQKRLDAIEALGELGSGFQLATHDLEIRGAGELLGDEQSGQIEEVGFTLYAELLARAVKAIRNGTLDDSPFGASDCEVDLGTSALIPDDFIPDIHTRLSLYKRITEAADTDALYALQLETIDRFGSFPPAADALFTNARLRLLAERLGITRVRASARSVSLEFGERPDIDPIAIIRLVQSNPKTYRLEGQHKLHYAADLSQPEARAEAAESLLTLLGKKPTA